jgi:hypothetical protein
MTRVTVQVMKVLLAETCDVQERSIVKQIEFIYFHSEKSFCGNLRERDHMIYLGVQGIILK